MKKGGGKNPKFDGSSGHEPKQQEATGTAADKYRAPFEKSGGSHGGWKQQHNSSSSSSTWSQSHPRGVQQQQQGDRNNQDQNQQKRRQFPVGWAAIEEINQKVQNNQLLEGSNDLLAKMDTDAVHLRIDELWPDPEKQQVFLNLIVLTGGAIHEGIQHLTQAFLRRALQSKLVDSLFTKHIVELRPQRSATIVASLAELLLLGWTTFPSLMAEKLALQTKMLILTVNDQRSATFPSAQLDELLTRLDVVRKSVVERQNANEAVERVGGRKRNRPNESTGPPPEDFRTLEIQLSEDDILAQNEAVYLRKAIVQGPYQNDEHYLDVQFRLLREDLCRPLRAGIHEFRANQNNNGNYNRNNNRNSLFVYRDVQFAGIELNNQDGKMLAYLRLSQRDQRRRMHRRFLFGSLICLSADGFADSFIFGTIMDRDGIVGGGRVQQQQNNNQLGIEKRGTVGILLQQFTVASQLRQGIDYLLVESPAFYECYNHVLRALQSIRFGQPVPFSKYLVRMHPNPALPRYQRDVPPYDPYGYRRPQQQQPEYEALPLNFRSLLVNRASGPDAALMMRCASTVLTEEFTADQFGMDQSQFEAFAYALRSEVAIIQGPPGTGKTYLGLKVVRLLFDNRHLWTAALEDEEEEEDIFDDLDEYEYDENLRLRLLVRHRQDRLRLLDLEQPDGHRPMLIVCYTNHALDQFLEGILTFLKDGIVRVGGQSKNEALEKFNLRNLQNDRTSYVPFGHRQRYWKCRQELVELAKRMRQMKKELVATKRDPGWIVSYKQLFEEDEDDFAEEHPFDAILKRQYKNFFEYGHSDYTAWLTMAKPRGSAAQRYDIYVNTWQLVHHYNMPEELANLAYLYCMSIETEGDNWEVLNALYEPTIHRFWLKRLRYLLQQSGREQEFRAKVNEWPTLAEVDSLLQIGVDAQVAVELLSSIKRDGNYAENLLQIHQHHLRGHQQQNAPAPAAAVGEDFQAMGLQENQDDYADPENEARMFHEVGDLLPGNDQLDETEAEQKQNQQLFQNSTNLRKYLATISSSTPMSERECQQMATVRTTDPWDLPLLTRWRLYKRWIQLWEPSGQRACSKLIREYGAKRSELDELRSVADVELMRRAKVVGMTTTSAARLQSSLRSVKPRIVVVEEAAEVFEQHILTSLTECCEHLILIGDHQQLQPTPADYQLGKQYNLEISMFERLVMNGFEYKQLSTQHRMRPEISATMMGHFYTNLQDHSSVQDYPNVLGLQKNLFFLTHSVLETSNQDEAKSHANKFEAEFAVQLAKYLHKQGYEGSQITILCTYADQFFDIRQRLDQSFGGDRSHGIRVANVDNYQGEECDIIILSLVRSNNPQNRIGFLNTANRVCVAMSRAKHGFYIFGNMDFLAQNCTTKRPSSSSDGDNTNIWAGIRQSLLDTGSIGTALPIVCQLHENAQEITSPDQFDQLSPEGGCTQPCGIRMDCGHTCRKPCHAFDPEHTKMKCMEKCGRRCPNELHDCPKWCYQECELCPELVHRQLPCGHSRMAQCHLKPEELECKEPCELMLSKCGHPCANNCSQICTQKCAVPMERTLPCGHTITLECHEDPLEHKCQKEVQKRWPICGHLTLTKCCQDPAELPCPAPCGKPLAECDHPCMGTCGQCRQGRLHQDCAQDCQRILICGHECRSKCAKVCPPCSRPCETACKHNKCSKKAKTKHAKGQGRTCGDRCPPCAEKCSNKCIHRRCTKKCSEPCDVKPCEEPCTKPLPCSIAGPKPAKGSDNSFLMVHPCIGVCGEPCIDICAICQPKKLAEIKEIFFGTEEDEGARFVQLQECKHIFESTGLDMAIQVQLGGRDADGEDADAGTEANGRDSVAIVVIKCPKCSTPIRNSNRYIKLLNERAVQIDKVKKKLLGDKTKKELLVEWDQLRAQMMAIPLEMNTVTLSEEQRIVDAFEKIRNSILDVKNFEITGQWMVMAHNISRLLLGFSQSAQRISDSLYLLDATTMMTSAQFPRLHNVYSSTICVPLHHLQSYLLQDLCQLLESLANRKVRNLADSTLVQLSSELGRHHFLIKIITFVGSRQSQNWDWDIDAKGEQMLTELLSSLQTAQAFSEQKEKLDSMLDDFIKHSGGVPVSKEEMVKIQMALNGDVSKWYTCPKGHVYGIGNCGQAMQQSQCIECKETVGGTGHQLVANNAEATELNREFHRADPFVERF